MPVALCLHPLYPEEEIPYSYREKEHEVNLWRGDREP